MSLFKSRKFRVDILTIFITLFLFSILGITYYFYSRSSTAVLTIANSFISRSIDSISQKMDQFMQPTPLFSMANLIMNDTQLDATDMAALTSYMHVVLQSYPQLINAYIADTNGNLFIESRVTGKVLSKQFIPFADDIIIPLEAKFVSEIVTPFQNSANVILIFKNQGGLAIKQSNVRSVHFDPRKRQWYLDAKANKQVMWIGIYPFYKEPIEVITIAFPIYVDDVFMGVAAADLNITSVRAAMDRFSIDAKGVVFIANHLGQLITSQQDAPDQDDKNNTESVYSTKNPLIKNAYQLFLKNGFERFTFIDHDVKYIAQFKTYSISGREKWEIGVVIPIDVFVGSINEVNKNALLFSLATLLIGLVLVIFSSNKISKPIIALAAETKRMRRLNFSQSPPIESHIYEVQVMVEAVKVAKSALSSFAKYVPKMLVEQLMHNGNIAELGGEKKHITVLFSDICNFTHVTETTDANDLMLHLSDYLNELTMCIQHYKGSIDKYMGDAIMALWGVPQPDEDQVKHACLALLACRHKVEQHCQESELHGKPRFKTRFGLNTGFAIVGNVGSSDRLNYTAIGDAVNVASRLEKINKDYNTDIIVSEAVHAACSETFLFRPIDIVMIKGKNAPIQIYELVAENIDGHEFPATLDQLALCSHFAEAYTLYHANEFVQALDRFNQISHLFPEDSMTTLYIHRCHKALDAN